MQMLALHVPSLSLSWKPLLTLRVVVQNSIITHLIILGRRPYYC